MLISAGVLNGPERLKTSARFDQAKLAQSGAAAPRPAVGGGVLPQSQIERLKDSPRRGALAGAVHTVNAN